MKKIYIPVIVSVIAICFLFVACGKKDNMANDITSTTTTTTISSTSGKPSTTTTDKTNMVEDGITKASEEMSEMASEVKSDLSEMQ